MTYNTDSHGPMVKTVDYLGSDPGPNPEIDVSTAINSEADNHEKNYYVRHKHYSNVTLVV